MKRINLLLLCAALTFSLGLQAMALEQPQDSETAATYLVERGILQGNSSGDLMLEKGLNRAELAAILTRLCVNPEHVAYEKDYYVRQCKFTDVPDWARLYVGVCVANSLMEGYGDGRFGANDSVTPAAAATVMLRYIEYFDSPWDYSTACDTAIKIGLLPTETAERAAITRGDMAILIYRAMGNGGYQQGKEPQTESETTIPPVIEDIGKNADGSINIPDGDAKLELKEGDVVRCDDGTNYTITDMSRYDSNAFADGPLPTLPTATCDWSSFPAVELPEVEVRHLSNEYGDYLFIRNLYETRRMQYTIMNLAGNHPDTSENGKLRYGSKGTPLVRIQLSIDAGEDGQSFWPWRSSELEKDFNSLPIGNYAMEAWDVYRNGIFQYTEYVTDFF